MSTFQVSGVPSSNKTMSFPAPLTATLSVKPRVRDAPSLDGNAYVATFVSVSTLESVPPDTVNEPDELSRVSTNALLSNVKPPTVTDADAAVAERVESATAPDKIAFLNCNSLVAANGSTHEQRKTNHLDHRVMINRVATLRTQEANNGQNCSSPLGRSNATKKQPNPSVNGEVPEKILVHISEIGRFSARVLGMT